MVRCLNEVEREKFKEMYLKGCDYSEISRELGIPKKHIPLYARVLGLPRRSAYGGKLTDEVLEKIKTMRLEGMKVKEIAEVLGYSEDYVGQLLIIMCVKKRSKCVEIPKEVIEDYIVKKIPKHIASEELGISMSCLKKLMRKYGLKYQVGEATVKDPVKISEMVVDFFRKLGRTYTLDFREDVKTINKELYRSFINLKPYRFFNLISQTLRGVEWFKISYTSTHRYTVLPSMMNGKYVVYMVGSECEVIKELASMVSPETPLAMLKYLLKSNGAPQKLVESFNTCV